MKQRDEIREEVFLDMDEAAELLHVSKQTLYKYTMNREVPFYKPTQKILFKKSELMDWMELHRVPTTKQLMKEHGY